MTEELNPEVLDDVEKEKKWHCYVNTVDLAKHPGTKQTPLEAEPKEMIELKVNGREPLLVCIPHSGQMVPEAAAGRINWRHPTKTQLAEGAVGVSDLYTDQIYNIGDMPCTELLTRVSRMFFDEGRPPLTDVEVEEQKRSNPKFRVGMGGGSPFWTVLLDASPNFSLPLSEAEQEKLITEYHYPYHQLIDEQLDRMVAQNGFALLFDGHSMPGVVEVDHEAAPENDQKNGGPLTDRLIRKPFCILNNLDLSAPPEVMQAFKEALETSLQTEPYNQLGYGPDDITVGFPFTGKSYSISHHTSKDGVRWGLGLEMAKHAYMKDETTLEPDPERIKLLNSLVREVLKMTLDKVKEIFASRAKNE